MPIEADVELEPLLTNKEMAALVKVATQTLDTWRKRGVIPCVRVGNVIRYNRRRVLKALGS